jgi:hypothetical protein
MFLVPRYRNHISAFYCTTTNETSVFRKEEFDVWMESVRSVPSKVTPMISSCSYMSKKQRGHVDFWSS